MEIKQSKQVIKFKESEIKKDKYNREYKIITFQSESYLYSKSLIYKDNYIYHDKIGTKYLGDIIKERVKEYSFNDSIFNITYKVNSFKSLVLGNTYESNYQKRILEVFKQKGHEIIKENNGIISMKSL